MLAILTDTQQLDITYSSPKDKKGADAAVQAGSVVGKSSDETVATAVVVTETPLVIRAVAGLPGVCQVWPEADADLGDGVTLIQGEKVDVSVSGGQATGFGSPTLGTPVEQP